VVEAVSATVNAAPVLAVQWHPEWRTERNPQSQAFFQLFGRALRGEDIIPLPLDGGGARGGGDSGGGVRAPS
jgi:putative glutamine amidotransferase